MTILELRSLFENGTEFWFEYMFEDVDDYTVFEITNILFGCSAFSLMEIRFGGLAISGNKVFIKTDIPYEVFKAWKNYAKENR